VADKWTPKDFAREMAAICHPNASDPEMDHVRADELLCEVLEQLGYGEGVAVFRDAKKWYA
jgi:hypothetical protein